MSEMKKMDLSKMLIDKSIEAFIMGLEIYNKPTIKYRVEGFSFFICNAWELMLKAQLIKERGESSIYYKDSYNRTISLENCLKNIFTNKKDPLRINLETIIELRNTSTHFITEDYEKVYAPLFQASVKNFCDKLLDFHKIDITDRIAQDFLTLRVSFNDFDVNELYAKYPSELAQKLIFNKNNIEILKDENNSNFAFTINHNVYITKKIDEADFSISVDRDSKSKGKIIRELRDPKNTHKFSYAKLTEYINDELSKRKIEFSYELSGGVIKTTFTKSTLNLFIRFYDMKNNEKYAYGHVIGETKQYTYSLNAAEFILTEIKKAPKDIYQKLKNALKK